MPEGAIVDKKYRITKQLVVAGMSTVYLAHRLRTRTLVILKASVPGGEAILSEAMNNESNLLDQKIHPAFAKLHGVGRHADGQYQAMEIIPGVTIQKVMENEKCGKGTISVEMAVDWIIQVCDQLAALHQHEEAGAQKDLPGWLPGWVHRDIKDSNIMVTKEGRARVIDFGLACPVGHQETDNKVQGTPNYMSPDQIRNKPLDGRVDIYSLGLVLYTILTGRNPKTAMELGAVLNKQLHEALPPIKPDDIKHRITGVWRWIKVRIPYFGKKFLHQLCTRINGTINGMTAKERDERMSIPQALGELEAIKELVS
ncbi:serine/threonine protein kinase [Candidatus Margulisiibacteriota bacterium]